MEHVYLLLFITKSLLIGMIGLPRVCRGRKPWRLLLIPRVTAWGPLGALYHRPSPPRSTTAVLWTINVILVLGPGPRMSRTLLLQVHPGPPKIAPIGYQTGQFIKVGEVIILPGPSCASLLLSFYFFNMHVTIKVRRKIKI